LPKDQSSPALSMISYPDSCFHASSAVENTFKMLAGLEASIDGQSLFA
jgi:hypothetical protein